VTGRSSFISSGLNRAVLARIIVVEVFFDCDKMWQV